MIGTKLRPQPHERIDRDVARRYAVGKRIGRGFYGVVWEVVQTAGERKGRNLALKKALHAFRDPTDAQRSYREVSYLLEFGDHDNILQIHDVLCSADDRHLYIVTDLMDSDLQKALRCQSLRAVHRPWIAYQLLRALKYIHSAGVMHRDVKPSNIFLNADCRTVLADFGWARSSPVEAGGSDGVVMTDYASTRWYRAPELLLGARHYTTAVDLWAFGCVVAEMHGERALFPGTSTVDMLSLLTLVLGKPLASDVAALEAPYASFSLDSLPPVPPHKPLESLFSRDTAELIDFLKLLLQWNPDKRFLADEAMHHPYVGSFCNPDDEPVLGNRVSLALSDDELHPAGHYRDHIYADVIGFDRAKRQVERLRIWRLFEEAEEEEQEEEEKLLGDLEAPPPVGPLQPEY